VLRGEIQARPAVGDLQVTVRRADVARSWLVVAREALERAG
jgi:hypothetical protein